MIAAEPQSDVVFGQQYLCNFPEFRGFVFLDPQKLRRRETWHGDVAGDVAQPRLRRFEFAAFIAGASVIPENCGPDNLVGCIEECRTMHLAGQTDSRERPERFWRPLAY